MIDSGAVALVSEFLTIPFYGLAIALTFGVLTWFFRFLYELL